MKKFSKKQIVLSFFVLLLTASIGLYLCMDNIRKQHTVDNIDPLIASPLIKAITEHPTKIRKAIKKMIIGGVAVEDIRFSKPDNLSALSNKQLENEIFSTYGGGLQYQIKPESTGRNSFEGSRWTFNGELAISEIGTEEKSEIIAFLIGVSEKLCFEINREYLVGKSHEIPKLTEDLSAYYQTEMVSKIGQEYKLPNGKKATLDHESLQGIPSACFQNYADGSFVFYSVVLER